jgi:hypothetical protein
MNEATRELLEYAENVIRIGDTCCYEEFINNLIEAIKNKEINIGGYAG